MFKFALVAKLAAKLGLSQAKSFAAAYILDFLTDVNPTSTAVSYSIQVYTCLLYTSITKVTDKMVPIMVIIYVIGGLIVLGAHITAIPEALVVIIKSAFSPMAAAGGFAGSSVAAAIRWGAARGAYSNEAGDGAAPFIHSAATVDHPIRQGFFGVFEVFVDTMVVCTFTGLICVVSGAYIQIDGANAATMPSAAFSSVFGSAGPVFIKMCIRDSCKKAPELLREAGVDERTIHAVVSHGYGLCSDVEPEHEMEKVLFACDELTGLIGAAALMRPSKSCKDMELKSLKKKFKDKRFAAGCNRDVIISGAQMLGWDLDELLEQTLEAMKTCEEA